MKELTLDNQTHNRWTFIPLSFSVLSFSFFFIYEYIFFMKKNQTKQNIKITLK